MLCGCFHWKSTQEAYPNQPTMSPSKVKGFEANDDPRIPLTQKQKYLLIRNWKGIDRQACDAGVEMFLKMLSTHPEHYTLFPFRTLATSNDEKKRMDECLRSHAEAVMKSLSQIINSIGDAEKFFELTNENGRNHAHKRNFKPELFWLLEEPFLYSVKVTLGERYTENMHSIYKAAIALVLKEMEKGCENEQRKMHNND